MLKAYIQQIHNGGHSWWLVLDAKTRFPLFDQRQFGSQEMASLYARDNGVEIVNIDETF